MFPFRRRAGAPVVLLHTFHAPPYGGGNQFLLALRAEWLRCGLEVGVGADAIGPETRAVLFNSHHVEPRQLARIRREGLRLVHRVDGPISVYRGRDDGTDQRIWQMNHDFADVTIFQSHFSLDRHHALGLRFREPHVIHNAADPAIFSPEPAHRPGQPLRLIASSWSDNPRKGASVYQWLDAQLEAVPCTFTFVGRIGCSLPHSRVLDAVPSAALSELLRQHDVFVTASEDDPCSNALIEAMTCGLPAVYRNSGGHPELVREGGIGFDQPEDLPVALRRIADDYATYRSRVDPPRLADVAQAYLRVLGVEAA